MYSAVWVPQQVSVFQWDQTNLLWTCSDCHTIGSQYGNDCWYYQIRNPVSSNWNVEAITANIYSTLVRFDLSPTRNRYRFRILLIPYLGLSIHSIIGTLNATCCSAIGQIRNRWHWTWSRNVRRTVRAGSKSCVAPLPKRKGNARKKEHSLKQNNLSFKTDSLLPSNQLSCHYVLFKCLLMIIHTINKTLVTTTIPHHRMLQHIRPLQYHTNSTCPHFTTFISRM
jgi:hypothetical protein